MSWKLAVSTLGMPGRPLAESAATAASYGCAGLEIRVHPDEELNLDSPAPARDRARATIADAGLEIACLAGYSRLCAPEPDAVVVDGLRRLIGLAEDVGAPSIRVFPGGTRADTARGQRRIAAVADDLGASGVRLLVETHDSHPRVADALRLVEPVGDPAVVALLWDAVHPWLGGEAPGRSRELAGDYLGYFQVKDLAVGAEKVPVPPGAGDLPLDEHREVLAGWSGWVSLEWELAWYPQIGSVEPALAAAREWVGP
ncbi:sugar phosphate isomerase/epimerase family protein [Zhihengliuella salsuginis]|uniref:Xylose isomerase n=1 Tax=Zhihengliuella salsuginis TaxID=578222 RepID=A0ABQ3GJD6_9MICC|nr:sugar phosphate isomerase/epimerase family protein [Zhihengliuella salsuginis]GHD06922.1 xylose isomerase [Zhihengliuella salsuginis]